jgi:hypothetical protein
MALHTRQARSARGTSVIEMVLVIPLLATIIFLVWFFGWSMTNQQHVRISDRYTAWRTFHGGGVTNDGLNDSFFDSKAININVDYTMPDQDDTIQDFIVAAATVSPEAQSLADRTAGQKFPRGRRDRVWAEFPSTVGLWQKYAGQITSISGREGLEWRYTQAQESGAITDQFLQDIETTLNAVPAPGDDMATMIRRLYISGW